MAHISFLVEEISQGGYKAYTQKPPIDVQSATWDGLQRAIDAALRFHFGEENTPVAVSLTFVVNGIPLG